MKLPGMAWLEFNVEGAGATPSCLMQTARFYPRGLFGIVYWYGIYPVHMLVFRGLAKAIARRAEKATDNRDAN